MDSKFKVGDRVENIYDPGPDRINYKLGNRYTVRSVRNGILGAPSIYVDGEEFSYVQEAFRLISKEEEYGFSIE